MDNLTHSLVGLAIAHSGFRRRTAMATAALVIGANLPDVDAVMTFTGDPTHALAHRRGWTHGVLALAIWPFVLTWLLLWWDRRKRRTDALRPVPDTRWLFLAGTVGIISHPILDWMNSYGVRLLMPFSDRWFYGDAWFIVEPWVLAVLAIGLILATRQGLRWAAPVTVGVLGAYAIAMVASSRLGRRVVAEQAPLPPARAITVSPTFTSPMLRTVIRDLGSAYEYGTLHWHDGGRYAVTGSDSAGTSARLLDAVRATDAGARYLRWSRYPLLRVEGDSVVLSDARYGRGRSAAWAVVKVGVR
ncbi:MAG TPA: metal-dependent hydrolase [Gemmatimonadales bacterium]|nr:metal-dependent hydrolase [Gemmatimonadales bacterium]